MNHPAIDVPMHMPSSAMASTELLIQIADAIPHVVFVANGRTGSLEHVSSRFSDVTGVHATEALGFGYRRFVHPDDLVTLEAAARNALRSGAPLRSEARLRDRDGIYRWHELRATPFRWRAKTRRWFGTCTDTDATHRAGAMQRALAELAGVLTTARTPDEVLRTFAEAVVVSLADVCAIDLSEEDAQPRRAAVALASTFGPLPATLETADRTAPLAEMATRRIDPAAAPSELFAPLPVTSGVVLPITLADRSIGHVALATLGRATPFDVRDRSALEDVVRRLTCALTHAKSLESAQHSAHLRDELLAVVSHELRTPLSTILGWARLIRSEPQNEARRLRGLEVIERSALTQGRIIDDLLDVSRAMSGKLRLDPQEVSLSALARDAASAMRVAASEKSLVLDVTTVGIVTVRVDPERIRQVVWNLLSNAVKFTPSGGRIALTVSSDSGVARIEVTDTGIGLDPSFLPFVLDRFRQADSSSTRDDGGLGLGLALVRAIVEQHGGHVRAESEGLGCGCRMVVELPERARASAPPEPSAEARAPSTDLSGVGVLVVDDDPDARDLCALILGMHGVRVSTAASAADAMMRLESEEIDVLVSDIGMPQEDGCSLASRALIRHPRLRCVALSAYARGEDSERALRAGFLRYLCKPVDPSFLVDTLREITRAP